MPATRSPWRTLIAVFQAVMLVALHGTCAGHARAAAAPVAQGEIHHRHVAAADAETHLAAVQPHDSAASAHAGGDGASGPCDLACGCHLPPVRCATPSVAIAWTTAGRLVGRHDVAFDSHAPETLPEPPRTFA